VKQVLLISGHLSVITDYFLRARLKFCNYSGAEKNHFHANRVNKVDEHQPLRITYLSIGSSRWSSSHTSHWHHWCICNP